MIISSCPACHEPVTVPQGASGSARVRCPRCSDEFVLSAVLDKLPPMLILLDAPAAAAASTGDSGIALGSERSPSESPAFEFDAAGPSAGPMKTVSPSARPKPKERSMIFEMVKIVGGGVVGLGLAILILWHVAKRDPFELGPKVSAYAPWMVPKQFRGKAADTDTSDDGASSAKVKNGGSTKVAGGPAKGPKGKGVEDLPAFPGVGTSPKPVEPEPLVGDPFDTGTKKPDDDLGLNLGPSIPTKPKETKPKETKPVEPTIPPDEPAKPQKVELVKNLKPITVSDLSRAVTQAGEASADIDAALTPETSVNLTNEKKREFTEKLYNTFAKLGEVLISADANDPEVQSERSKLDPLLQDLAKNGAKQKLLAAMAELQPESAKRGIGLCVVGTVKRIEPSGKLYEVEVEMLTKKASAVTVLSGDDPSAVYKVGSKVLLLGLTVADPKENLSGYEGESAEARVVHFHFPLPEPAAKPEPKPEAAETPAKPADSEANQPADDTEKKPDDAPAEKQPADAEAK